MTKPEKTMERSHKTKKATDADQEQQSTTNTELDRQKKGGKPDDFLKTKSHFLLRNMTLTSITTRLSVWLLLVVASSSLLTGVNAGKDNIFMNVWSADESMKQEDCAKTIQHPDINKGKSTIVDDAISDVFRDCIKEGSKGVYINYALDHYTIAAATIDYNMTQQVPTTQRDDTIAHRRLPSCPPSCGGWTCGSNCNLCCLLCGLRQYCGGTCQSCRRRLGSPEEPSFLDEVVEVKEEEEEDRSLAKIKSTHIIIDPIAVECRDELRVLTTKLNARNNFCLGTANGLERVTPVITL
jgi:hypothetical protein